MRVNIIEPHEMVAYLFETPDVSRPTVYVKIKSSKPVSYYLMDSDNYAKLHSNIKDYSAFLKQGPQLKHEASHKLPKNGRWWIIIVNSHDTIVDYSCRILFHHSELTG